MSHLAPKPRFLIARKVLPFALLLAILAGCNSSTKPADSPSATETSQEPPLRVLVIDDPELARTIERHWTAQTERPFKIRNQTSEEVFGKEQRRLASDVVIYPSSRLGDLAGRGWLEPLADQDLNATGFQRSEIWEALRLHETNWGGKTVAVPLGSPTFLLCYRRDIFEQLELAVPKTWVEYQELSRRLADPSSFKELVKAEQEAWSGSVEPLATGWSAELFLARAACYARHRSQFSTLFDYRTLQPLIDGPPFVRALEELVAANSRGAKTESKEAAQDRERMKPATLFQELVAGSCAMAITWPTTTVSQEPSSSDALPIGFAPLPGSREVYDFRNAKWEPRESVDSMSVPLIGFDGRLSSITKECRSSALALELLLFLSGPQMSDQISTATTHTTLYRESHLEGVEKWIGPAIGQQGAQRYGETLQKVLNSQTYLTTLRIPGRDRYMAALEEAIYAALDGKSSPADALKQAAEAWNSITQELGLDSQREAYVQSIGLGL